MRLRKRLIKCKKRMRKMSSSTCMSKLWLEMVQILKSMQQVNTKLPAFKISKAVDEKCRTWAWSVIEQVHKRVVTEDFMDSKVDAAVQLLLDQQLFSVWSWSWDLANERSRQLTFVRSSLIKIRSVTDLLALYCLTDMIKHGNFVSYRPLSETN